MFESTELKTILAKLIVTDANGVKDETVRTITVLPLPEPRMKMYAKLDSTSGDETLWGNNLRWPAIYDGNTIVGYKEHYRTGIAGQAADLSPLHVIR